MKELEALLGELGVKGEVDQGNMPMSPFVAPEGAVPESFIRVSIACKITSIDAFVCEREAGFMVGDEWTICEHQDFRSERALMENFLKKLREEILGTSLE